MQDGMKINGWTISRDGRGFWASAEGQRHGPFLRPGQVRTFARDTTAPEPPRAKKVVTKDDE